jgi:hypothetical protein
MATQTQSITRTILTPTVVTTDELRITLNLKTPEGCTKNEAIRFNNELVRICKARGFIPMVTKKDTVEDDAVTQ